MSSVNKGGLGSGEVARALTEVGCGLPRTEPFHIRDYKTREAQWVAAVGRAGRGGFGKVRLAERDPVSPLAGSRSTTTTAPGRMSSKGHARPGATGGQV